MILGNANILPFQKSCLDFPAAPDDPSARPCGLPSGLHTPLFTSCSAPVAWLPGSACAEGRCRFEDIFRQVSD
ncbi:unnamed protein product [Protopolystoma xenopodis]|uniref:Uncharacterized protein n=1 Tax=Protopolystoma xenopodis TaxID=117903 RepID=A0A448X1J4_9PLAT|nr:unnamed protein product [Protopolystoma xenopodis]